MIPLEALVDVIANCEVSLANSNLAVPKMPEIYVPPKFRYVESDGTLESDVVFVQAPAAVGKSITAKYIASANGVPMLDLAKVPVGTDSLRGMIGNDAALEAFRTGDLPIIVDSIDEGRIVSGDQSFERFLSSTGDLLAASENHGRPKIVFFGRPESAELAEIVIGLDEEVSLCKIELDYFDKHSALDLINKSAAREIDENPRMDATTKHRKKNHLCRAPMNELKDTYFNAIAQALDLSAHDLWTDRIGRSFAGYAPVLSTLAIMIAGSENPFRDRQHLEFKGADEAWEVVSKVLGMVMEREQEKLKKLLKADIQDLPDSAYSTDEQLSYLSQLTRGTQIAFAGNFRFRRDEDEQRYLDQVNIFLSEHPFVRDGKAANDVLGAAIGAHVILTGREDLSTERGHDFVALSRKPFLWRHLRETLLPDTVIDGAALGYLLHSYFNDPLNMSVSKIIMRDSDDGGVSVIFVEDNDNIRVNVIPPIVLFQGARGVDIDIDTKVVIDGPQFVFSKTNFIRCGDLEFRPGIVWIHHGELFIYPSGNLLFGDPIHIRKEGSAKISLSQKFSGTQWPIQYVAKWVSHASRSSMAGQDVLEFISYLKSQRNRSVVVTREYALSKTEKSRQWKRAYDRAFPYSKRLLGAMVDLGHAETASIDASTAMGLYRIAFNHVDWDRLEDAFNGEDNVYSDLSRAVYRRTQA